MEEKKRTKCEVYSRIVGYLRPISQWNDGARARYNEQKFAHFNDINADSLDK